MPTSEIITDPLLGKKEFKERKIKTWMPDKICLAKRYIDEETIQKSRALAKGSIHYCSFGENIGSEQNEERPVIIISSNVINSSSGNVIVAPITSTLKKRTDRDGNLTLFNNRPAPKYPSHYFLFKDDYTFLLLDSAVMTEVMSCVSKIRLTRHLGNVSNEDIKKIDSKIKWTMGL